MANLAILLEIKTFRAKTERPFLDLNSQFEITAFEAKTGRPYPGPKCLILN